MTATQLQLLDTPAAAAAKDPLSPRLRYALDQVTAAGQNGLHPEELGALLHHRANVHAHDVRCEHCGRDGARLLRDLHRRRLITRRHGNAGVAVTDSPAAAGKQGAGMSDGIPY